MSEIDSFFNQERLLAGSTVRVHGCPYGIGGVILSAKELHYFERADAPMYNIQFFGTLACHDVPFWLVNLESDLKLILRGQALYNSYLNKADQF